MLTEHGVMFVAALIVGSLCVFLGATACVFKLLAYGAIEDALIFGGLAAGVWIAVCLLIGTCGRTLWKEDSDA